MTLSQPFGYCGQARFCSQESGRYGRVDDALPKADAMNRLVQQIVSGCMELCMEPSATFSIADSGGWTVVHFRTSRAVGALTDYHPHLKEAYDSSYRMRLWRFKTPCRVMIKLSTLNSRVLSEKLRPYVTDMRLQLCIESRIIIVFAQVI